MKRKKILIALTALTVGVGTAYAWDGNISRRAFEVARYQMLRSSKGSVPAPGSNSPMVPPAMPVPPGPDPNLVVYPAFGGVPPVKEVPQTETRLGRNARTIAQDLAWGGRPQRAPVKYAPPETPAGSIVYREEVKP
jgi:hypothetical protein